VANKIKQKTHEYLVYTYIITSENNIVAESTHL